MSFFTRERLSGLNAEHPAFAVREENFFCWQRISGLKVSEGKRNLSTVGNSGVDEFFSDDEALEKNIEPL